MSNIKIGSLCCGMGGFDTGLSNIGFKTIWAMDIMKEACLTFKANYKETKVYNVDIKDIKDFNKYGKINGLIFGVPCQGFSIANTKRSSSDQRNILYQTTLKAIKETNCEFFIFENVKGLLSLKYDENTMFIDKILYDYQNCGRGYNLTWKLIDCANIGVPQVNRHRIIIVGIRKDIKFKYKFLEEEYGDKKMPYVTLKDTIYHLRNADQTGMYDTSGYSPMYLGRNRQKTWDEPSFTIEASGRQAKLHPDGGRMLKIAENTWHIPETCRKLSALECKLIQTFPEDYIVIGSLNKQYVQIGNAVPPKLAEYVGKPLLDMYK